MQRLTVNVSQFRSQLFELYRQHLADDSSQPRVIVVEDAKKSKPLFEVRPMSESSSKITQMNEHLEWLEDNYGAHQTSEKSASSLREQLEKDLAKRSRRKKIGQRR